MSQERELKRQALAARLGYDRRELTGYGLQGVLPMAADWEKRESVRQASLIGDVAVPLTVAIISGIFGGALIGIIGGLQAAGIGGLGIAAVAWVLLAIDSRNQLWRVERILNVDIDGDRAVGDPAARRVTVEMIGDNGKAWKFGDLPVDERTAVRVARSLAAGVSFSRSALSGAGSCSQDQYRRLAGWLIETGLAIRTANNATELTAAGRRLMASLLE